MTEADAAREQHFPNVQEMQLTPEEEAEIKARLWSVLEKQVRLHTQGDHSSLREEEAAELLRSLVFSLQVYLHRNSLPIRTLMDADLHSMLKQAQRILQTEVNTAGTLYRIALQTVPTFGSLSLQDTLAGIGQFFKAYDVWLYAHEIPASIDYPLCFPVPETLQGVLYIRTWLERLLLENKLIRCFPPVYVEALLCRASPDYRELLQNLYEPVAANVIGLAFLEDRRAQLEITAEQAARIHQQIAAMNEKEAHNRLISAAATACRRYSLTDSASVSYLSRVADALYPHLTLSAESAGGVFSCVR